ncbi:iron donor protein CyaY [Candidozyma pseudohaemuli]|uniref:ferroxidase n=1 Tax=Candidozyma pseudohaemuli TaxID=418784 RepID=A0A2P7YCK9_9ASCO|nr:iron donor protein CyaY [[Candida] pseudohaemulonii]PSK33708.1 iron donor protein CyaY [[Candida] pseudohaemulonii]
MFRFTARLPRALPRLSRLPVVRPATAFPRIAQKHYSISTSGENVSLKIDNILDHEYSSLANTYLELLSDSLEELLEDYPQIDAELNHGVMTLSVAPGKTYVINKQPPNKQIWLSSPVSGPKRYDLIRGKWTTLRDGSELTKLLDEELSEELGVEVELEVEE